jgi:hypothetical protein
MDWFLLVTMPATFFFFRWLARVDRRERAANDAAGIANRTMRPAELIATVLLVVATVHVAPHALLRGVRRARRTR